MLIENIVKDIRDLKIQGASNVAKASVSAIKKYVQTYEGKEDLFEKKILEISDMLANARPTEPMCWNAMKFIRHTLKKAEGDFDVKKEKVMEACEMFVDYCDAALEKIAKIGAKQILDGSVVLTHCHSSTVMHVFKEALDQGKRFEVVCTETRPRYQGRLTAEELASYGLPVTLIIDSAVGVYMPKMDLVMVGADAITSGGEVINKIGTSLIALCAHRYKKPFIIATELYKFDPRTVSGVKEAIEMRPREEVLEGLEDVQVKNPAFDLTPPEYIRRLITEVGIIPPENIYGIVKAKFAYLFD